MEAKMENTITFPLNDDEEFIESFESCRLPPECFNHPDHVRLAWLYLKRYDTLEALSRVSEGIKRFASFNGKAARYHETITWAYFFLIRERVARMGSEQSWEGFIAANADLFDWKDSVLKLHYSEETLRSDFARTTFVLPNR
jgi:hypothetical protein